MGGLFKNIEDNQKSLSAMTMPLPNGYQANAPATFSNPLTVQNTPLPPQQPNLFGTLTGLTPKSPIINGVPTSRGKQGKEYGDNPFYISLLGNNQIKR